MATCITDPCAPEYDKTRPVVQRLTIRAAKLTSDAAAFDRELLSDAAGEISQLRAALEAMLDAQSARRHPLGAPDEGIATLCAEAASKARAAIKAAKGGAA